MKTKNHGFTLVELMIAIVISLVAVLAATEVYVSTRQTNRLQGMQSRLSEDGRFAVSMLQRFLSQAGFRPAPSIALPDSDSPDGPPIAVANNVIRLRFVPDGANQIACDGSALRDAGGAFQAFSIGLEENSLWCRSLAVPVGAVAPWIVPAARAPGAAAGAAGNGTEVRDFKVWFGVDTGPANTPADFGCGVVSATGRSRDCIADSYVAALPAGVTSDQIKAVRVCLVLRSEAIDGSVVRPTPYRDCDDVDIPESQIDRKLYRTFVTTVLMKNLKDR
jgi:type IV pilus assembly protein PilW